MRAIGLVAGGAVAVVAPACSRVDIREGPGPAVRVQQLEASSGRRLNTVNIVDDSLQYWEGDERERRGKLAVDGTGSRRTAAGTLEVWATLRNRTDRDLQIEARTHFLDRDSVAAEPPSAWRRIYLPSNALGTYEEASTLPTGIAAYYIEVRAGR